MRPSRAAPAALLIVVLAGCRAFAPAASQAMPSATSPSPSPIEPTPEASQCSLGFGIAEIYYGDLRTFASAGDGVAIAEVVSVGPLAYSTESGKRPSCQYLAQARSVFGVGRMIELRVETSVAGNAVVGESIQYMLPGGTLGADTTAGHHFGLQAPAVGDRMLALLVEPIDVDGGAGVLEMNAYELFPIGDDGRVLTPNPDEHITTVSVAVLLRGLLPTSSPGG